MPSFVAAATAGGNPVSSVTVSVPAGTADGDLMLAWVSANDEDELTPPAGWDLVHREQVGENVASWLYERVASDEPADYTWTWGGPHSHHAIVTTWRDTSGIRAWGINASDSTDELDLPQVEAAASDLLVALGFNWSGMSGSQPTWPAELDAAAVQGTILSAAYEAGLPAGLTEPYVCSSIQVGHMSAMAVVLAPLVEGVEVAAEPFAVQVGLGEPGVGAASAVEATPFAVRVRYGSAALEGTEPPPPDPWAPIPERRPLPPRQTWRYYAFRALSREWVHRELPLREVSITHTLSGPGALTASIEPTYADLMAPDGGPVLREWDTVIIAEAAGQIRGGGILTSMEITGDALSLDCVGFSGYAAGQPLASSLRWGGSSAGTTGEGVDPQAVIWWLWEHLQEQPDGNLGVTMTNLRTPYRMGEWHNARKLATEDEPNPSASEVQEPPIPIDRVWTPQDKKPAAATGKQVYWEYRLDWFEDVEVGQQIDQICQQVPIDYRETWRWADSDRESVVMHLELGYPRLGRRQSGLRFVEGENITAVITLQRSGDDFANAVSAYGAGEGSKQLRQTVTNRDGRLRRVAVVDHEDVDSKAALKAIAGDELRRVSQITDITSFVVRDHPNAPLGSFASGDDVLVETTFGWQPIKLWVRITSYEFSPDGDSVSVTCARSDSFDYSGRSGGGP